jgi:L-cysteine:1D-myo-inositol 2-amino-2-deoxy-alpha-D-glucopyranoside ligase
VLADVRSALADDLDAPRALGSVDRWARDALAPDAVREPTDFATVRTAVDALLGVSL